MQILRSRSGKLPIVIIIVAVLVLALGAGAFAFLKMSHKGKKPAEKKKEEVKVVPWDIGEFLVNLADADDTRYLKATLVLEVADDGKKKGGGEGGGNPEEAKAKDVIINVMSKRHMNDLLTEKGKDEMKAELKTALNEALDECEIVNIYFTSFAMQ